MAAATDRQTKDLSQIQLAAQRLVQEIRTQSKPQACLLNNITELVSEPISLEHLVTSIQTPITPDKTLPREDIVFLEACLRNPSWIDLYPSAEKAVTDIQQRTISTIIPTKAFAQRSQFDPGSAPELEQDEIRDCQGMAFAGLRILRHLHVISSILHINPSLELISCLATFSDQQDVWTSKECALEANTTLSTTVPGFAGDADGLQQLLSALLEQKVRPLFAKSKNPAVTDQARKAIQSLSVPTEFNEQETENKPWKYADVYIVTVFRWIVNQLQACMTEKIWHLIIPPLLALIDDESTTNKVKGCETLMVLLKVTPSQFLQRTGLGDVFQDALTPCLSYLPSITPEEESIRLLNAVYPSLLSLTSTRYPMPQNGAQRITVLDKILRVGILTGYSHAGELVRIADMLVQRLSDIIELMGSMFVKHLQDIIPLLSSILSAPFATSYPPLLRSSVLALQVIILSGWPRLTSYRGDILKGLMICGKRINEEDVINSDLREVQDGIRANLRLLALAIKSRVDIGGELEMLLKSDPNIRSLLPVQKRLAEKEQRNWQIN